MLANQEVSHPKGDGYINEDDSLGFGYIRFDRIWNEMISDKVRCP